MATNLENAHATIEAVKNRFFGLEPGNFEPAFDYFEDAVTEHQGELLPQFRETGEIEIKDGPSQTVIVTVAWFRQPQLLNAFAALVFYPETNKGDLFSGNVEDWPKWLRDGVTHVATGITEAETGIRPNTSNH
jgi:hypothetical protein